jgi:MFS family permease
MPDNDDVSLQIVDDVPNGPTAEPPDGGYGWVCLVAVFFINGFVWGIIASFGVFLAFYLDNDVFPGGTDVDYAFIGGLEFSVAMLMAPVATYTCRRWYFKWTLGAGVTCLGGGFIAASFAKEVWQLFLTQGLLVGIGCGLIYVPTLPIVSQWFGKRRALANGITSAGSGVGGLAMSFAIQAIIENLGIAWALRITGLVIFAVNFPATMILRTRDGYVMPNRKMFDLVLFRRYDVFLVLAWAFIMMFGFITLTYSLSAYGRAIGLSASRASYQTAFMNLGIAFGRPLTGFLSDRHGRIEVPAILTFSTGVLCFAWWIPAKSFGSLTGFSLVAGAIMGIFWPALGPVATEVVGLKELPSALSLAWTTIVLPTTFSEVIALKLRRPSTSHAYLYPQIFAGLSYLVGSVCMFELARVLRKRKKLQIRSSEDSLTPYVEVDIGGIKDDEKSRSAA